jgi:hypothetical protein
VTAAAASLTPVTPLEAELGAVIGAPAAAQLVAAFAGRSLYVPRAPGPDHPVTAVIGGDAAALLGEYFHRVRLDFPISPARRRQVIEMRAAGRQVRDIAGQLRVTERFVYKVLAEARDDDADWQSGLFGPGGKTAS